jgi:hypothetical protein
MNGLTLVLEEPRKPGERKPGARSAFVEKGGVLPGLIVGSIETAPGIRNVEEVIVAVNDVIVAVTSTYDYPYSGERKFSVIVPEEAFRQGANEFSFFALDRGNLERPLLRVEGAKP